MLPKDKGSKKITYIETYDPIPLTPEVITKWDQGRRWWPRE